MREAISGTWLFNIVILFVMLFTGYLCLAVNYSRAYNVKNQIVNIIERENGLNYEAELDISEYLNDIGYRTTGKCNNDEGEIGNLAEQSFGLGENHYCYRMFEVKTDDDDAYSVYYQVRVFFRIDFPIFRDLFTFSVTGDSNQLLFPNLEV